MQTITKHHKEIYRKQKILLYDILYFVASIHNDISNIIYDYAEMDYTLRPRICSEIGMLCQNTNCVGTKKNKRGKNKKKIQHINPNYLWCNACLIKRYGQKGKNSIKFDKKKLMMEVKKMNTNNDDDNVHDVYLWTIFCPKPKLSVHRIHNLVAYDTHAGKIIIGYLFNGCIYTLEEKEINIISKPFGKTLKDFHNYCYSYMPDSFVINKLASVGVKLHPDCVDAWIRYGFMILDDHSHLMSQISLLTTSTA